MRGRGEIRRWWKLLKRVKSFENKQQRRVDMRVKMIRSNEMR